MMRPAICIVVWLVGIAALGPPRAAAQQIALSLNLVYTDPTDASSGGVWTIVGLADQSGIAGIDVKLMDVDSVQPAGPTGLVNDGDEAGFNSFVAFNIGGGVTEILAYQFPLDDVDGGHQNIFYGIGTLENGSPDYPMKPMGANSIGPELPSLTEVTGVPWGVTDSDFLGDPFWDQAVPLVRGSFAPGASPMFSGTQFGAVFLSTGSPDEAGEISCSPGGPVQCNDPATVMTIVRTNLMSGGSGGDYNDDGVVNAADYVLWRNGGPLANEGVTPGTVTQEDYDFWVEHFGTVSGVGTGAQGVAVPEPGTALLALVWGVGVLFWARKPGNRRSR